MEKIEQLEKLERAEELEEPGQLELNPGGGLCPRPLGGTVAGSLANSGR